jgi:glycosyltransferase involved in cell wall biosynthesis
MIRSLGGKFTQVAVKNGQFIIRPAKKAYKRHKELAPKRTYDTWVNQNEGVCFVSGDIKKKPLISIVVPAYNTDPSHYLAMIYSVINQHYENWELIVVNASDNPNLKAKINDSQDIDIRIKVVEPEKNLGIGGNTNFGLQYCTGEYVAFLDHDDLLHACALHAIAYTINESGAGIVYSDEDKIKEDGSFYFNPFFKPAWSPDLFENVNYINHLTAIKTEYITKVHGLRSGFDGAQDYDLLLRVIDICNPKIEHVPKVLYHWRAAQTSTANDFSVKSYVLEVGAKALQEHLHRQKIKGTAKAIVNRPGFYETLPDTPQKISIVVGPVDPVNYRLCLVWLAELAKRLDKKIKTELIIGEWLKNYKPDLGFETTHYVKEIDKNYWLEAAKAVSRPVVLCFTAAALPDNNQAVSKLAAMASVGQKIVSPFVIADDRNILDAGLVESGYGKQQLFTGCKLGDDSYYGSTEWTRNVAGLTLGFFAVSKENFADLASKATSRLLTDADLDKLGEIQKVVTPHAYFIYKGELLAGAIKNNQYFNPQLTQAHTDLYIKVPRWGKLKEQGERENAE